MSPLVRARQASHQSSAPRSLRSIATWRGCGRRCRRPRRAGAWAVVAVAAEAEAMLEVGPRRARCTTFSQGRRCQGQGRSAEGSGRGWRPGQGQGEERRWRERRHGRRLVAGRSSGGGRTAAGRARARARVSASAPCSWFNAESHEQLPNCKNLNSMRRITRRRRPGGGGSIAISTPCEAVRSFAWI